MHTLHAGHVGRLELALAVICDADPRIEISFLQTAGQFPFISNVTMMLAGRPVLMGEFRGECYPAGSGVVSCYLQDWTVDSDGIITGWRSNSR